MEYAYTSNEQSWENWDNLNRYNKAQTPQIDPLIYTQLDTLSDKFLKVRYAFLIMRNSYQLAVDSLLLMRFYDISIKNTDSLVFMHYYDSYIEKVNRTPLLTLGHCYIKHFTNKAQKVIIFIVWCLIDAMKRNLL